MAMLSLRVKTSTDAAIVKSHVFPAIHHTSGNEHQIELNHWVNSMRCVPALGWWLIAVGIFCSAFTSSCLFGSASLLWF